MTRPCLRVVADEPDFIVINKPPGVHFHSQDGNAGIVAQTESGLSAALYPVHRLDTPTSGLLILARSSSAAAALAEGFRLRQTEKYYLAIAGGKPKKKQGWIIGDMAKSRRGARKLLRSRDNPAITQFFSHSVAEGLRLYLLKPHTGKTHQLRVALSSLSTPILGDTLYGGHLSDRCYLHAFALRFHFNGRVFQYTCYPETGEQFLRPSTRAQIIRWNNPFGLRWPEKR